MFAIAGSCITGLTSNSSPLKLTRILRIYFDADDRELSWFVHRYTRHQDSPIGRNISVGHGLRANLNKISLLRLFAEQLVISKIAIEEKICITSDLCPGGFGILPVAVHLHDFP
jgi:hypothetical protein